MSPVVRIVRFPETKVAVLEHRGAPEREHETARRLIAWRLANRLRGGHHRSFGIHYTDPRSTPAAEHRVDFCISIDRDVERNEFGVIQKVIPANRCATARHVGSRAHIAVATYLYDVWLPASGEAAGRFPVFFHYVNVGPEVAEDEMITDVYLPLLAP